jgi:hypothetical protein
VTGVPRVRRSEIEAALKAGASVAETARTVGASVEYTRRVREEIGVAAKSIKNARGIKWDEQPLGEMPDMELARKLGVNVTTVLRARRGRGISAFVPTGRRPRRARLTELEAALVLGFIWAQQGVA